MSNTTETPQLVPSLESPQATELVLAPESIQAPKSVYRFVRVEEFFDKYQRWDKLDTVVSHSFDAGQKLLALNFSKSDDSTCVMLIYFPREDTIRVRFNPGLSSVTDYTSANTRTVVMDTFDQLIETMPPFTVEFSEDATNGQTLQIITKDKDDQPCVKVIIAYSPFDITVFKFSKGTAFQVWSTALPGIYYTPNGDEDYAVIQAVTKPATATYIGFGEHGGKEFSKNSTQMTYFNFDNMRYRQVYNRGPFEEREPLYHSDPFFIEVNGIADQDTCYGLLVDNPAQVFMDMGYLNSSRYLFGTRFGGFDYYVFFGDEISDILDALTAFVGKARLKPRYTLGYHQGCYGYDTRQKLEDVVAKYRQYQIPLDGLHVDVDIQKNYQTFTIDETTFPNPQEMFAALRAKGVKCSTNITPIISNRDPGYTTYAEGRDKGYFVLDRRCDPNNPDGRNYQDFGGGFEYYQQFYDGENNYNSGNPFIGEVYYGGDRGTTGHYADLSRKEVRRWWGNQYQYLFDMGLEMVWQDMTTPCIRSTRGDMRGFPFRLMVNNDFLSDQTPTPAPVIKVWNLYSYNLHKATYHGLNHLKGRENKRNFIIGRGCFTGIHRFAGLWTGDNSSSWEFFQINIAQVLALGMCGLAIIGQDIGGFEREEDWQRWADPELLIRWTAAGAFLPWFRNHYIAKGVKDFQEPYAYQFVNLSTIPDGERYLYGSVLPICKYYIELRYRLLQLFYDAMFENTLNGMPICRAMFLNDHQDKTLFNDKFNFISDQFFVRQDLLIAPVLEKQSNANGYGKRDIYLPAGSDWYQFVDNRQPLIDKVEGGSTIRDYGANIDASSGHIGFIVPMFVRAGAIIPTIELEQYVGELNSKNLPNPITLNIYPGPQGQYTMYLDDGVSRSSAPKEGRQYQNEPANSEYRETRISHEYTGPNTRQIKVTRVFDNYTPKFETYFFVAVLHDPTEKKGTHGPVQSISINGQAIDPFTTGTAEERANAVNGASTNAWYYNESINISFLKVFDTSPDITITATYA